MIREKDLPEGWKKVELKGIFEIRKGKKVNITENLKSDSIPYIFIGNLRDVPISQYSNDKKGLLCEDDDILLVWDGANCGTVGTGLTGYVGSTIARLRLIDNSLNKDYIFKFLKLKFKYFNSNTSGATIPHLDKKKVHSLKIPLPPKETQKKIVSILEKAEQLKEHRKEADKLTDDYLKSKFLEMFGDPVKNPKEWELKEMIEINKKLQLGFAFGKYNSNQGIIHLRPFNISEKGFLTFNEIKYVPNMILKPKYLLSKNNVIINTTNSYELVGKTAIFNTEKKCCLSNHMTKIEVNPLIINPYYLWFVLNRYWKARKLNQVMKRWVNQVGIDLRLLKQIKIPIPPIDLQNKFAKIVEKVEIMKEYQKNSIQQIDDLFNNLMQKAFKGELVC